MTSKSAKARKSGTKVPRAMTSGAATTLERFLEAVVHVAV
jgi:hypothetical protein